MQEELGLAPLAEAAIFGHLHEVICRPKSLDEWAVASKLWRLQAHLIGYVPQLQTPQPTAAPLH